MDYESLIFFCLRNYGARVGILVPNYRFFKQSIVEDLIKAIPDVVKAHPGFDYSRARDVVSLPNDARISAWSAEQVDRLRGNQFHAFWIHPAAASADKAIEQVRLCTRLKQTSLGDDLRVDNAPSELILA